MDAITRMVMRKLGRKGGLARAVKRTKAELSAIGRKGAAARWASTTLVTT